MATCSVKCDKPAVADFYSDAVVFGTTYVVGPYPICQEHIDILSRGRYLTQLVYNDGRVVDIREPGKSANPTPPRP